MIMYIENMDEIQIGDVFAKNGSIYEEMVR